MKSLYYCLGGGFGHITRFNAFCQTFSATPDLYTNCEAVRSGRIKTAAAGTYFPGIEEQKTKKALAESFRQAIKSSQADQIIIDAFPAGILGELADFDDLKSLECIFLARILKMPTYLKRVDGSLPAFSRIHILENLIPGQLNCFSPGYIVTNLELKDANPPIDLSCIEQVRGRWLIVHSGNSDELESLYRYALSTAEAEQCRPELAVIAPGNRPGWLPEGVVFFDIYPAHGIFKYAARVFSGAGFNIVRQMRHLMEKHYMLPFERALDDQHFRAAQAKFQI